MHLHVGCVACHLGKLLKALTANCVGLVDYTIAILYLHRVAEMLPYCWLKWGGRVRNLWVDCHVSSRSSSTNSTFAGRRHMIGKVVTGCRDSPLSHRDTGSWIWVSRFRFHIAYRYSPSVEFLSLSVCWPAHHYFVFYTQSTKCRRLDCKEKQQMHGYVIIIFDKNTCIN